MAFNILALVVAVAILALGGNFLYGFLRGRNPDMGRVLTTAHRLITVKAAIWTGAAIFIGLLWLLQRIAMRGHCQIWHRGDPWTPEVVATVLADAVIAACYFAIPTKLLFLAAKFSRARLPSWLVLLLVSFAFFVISCGLTHASSVFVRPLVFCTEDLIIKLATAGFSLTSTAGFILCGEALVLMVEFAGRSTMFKWIVGHGSPFETAAALRVALERTPTDGKVN